MNCLKCGFENPDGAKFCNCCGAELEDRVISEEQLDDQQPEEMYDAVPAEQESAFQLNMEGNQPEKRRSPVGIILAAVGVLLVAAVLVMLLVPACRAFVVRTFQSPEKLMYNVYSEAVSGAMENVDTAALEQKASSKTDTHLLLGDQVVSLAASMLYSQPEDLKALSDISVSCVINTQEDAQMMDLTLLLSGTEIVSAEQYTDQKNGKMYIVLPELNQQALMIDTSDIYDAETIKQLDELAQMNVDKKLLETLALRYMKQYFDAFESVEKTSKTVQLQGVTQKVTVLEATITERAQYEVLIAIFEALKTDQDAKQLIESLTPLLGENGYEDFLESLDSGISNAKSRLEDLTYDNEYQIKTYLNGRNSIVGFALTYLEAEKTTEAISYIHIMDGKQLAQKIVIGNDYVVEGSGSFADGLNANYTCWYQGKAQMDIKAEGISKNQYGFNGKITFIPSKDTVSEILDGLGLDSTIVQAGNLLDFSVEVTLDSSETAKNTQVSLMAGSSLLIGVTHKSEPHQSEAFTLPNNYVSIEDEEEMEIWAEGVQTEGVEKILENLEKAGLSKLLLEFATLLMNS